jgi:hypothetical protein
MTCSPVSVVTSYVTDGAVVMRSRSNSREALGDDLEVQEAEEPQRKPKPSATEVSGSYCSEASDSFSLSSASRRSA